MCYLICNKIGTPYFKWLVKKIEQLNYNIQDINIDSCHILNLSTYFYLEGNVDRSLKILEFAITRYTNCDIFLIQLCKIYILEHEFELAINALDNLWDQMNPFALFERFEICMLLHHENEARHYVKILLEKITHKEQVYAQFALFFTKTHDVKCARECWEAICKNPHISTNFQLTKVAIDYEVGNYKDAFELCQQIYNKQPHNLVISLYYAALSISLKKFNKGSDLIRHLEELHPTSLITRKLRTKLMNLR